MLSFFKRRMAEKTFETTVDMSYVQAVHENCSCTHIKDTGYRWSGLNSERDLTMDHIQTVSTIVGVCREYSPPLVFISVDHEKASDSVETNAILSVLINRGVDSFCVKTLADIWK